MTLGTLSAYSSPVIDRQGGVERTAWDVPEFGAIAVLVGMGVLVVGGLASGIDTAVTAFGAPTAVEFGAEWAEPVLAMILLGVIGLSWWQFQAWADADFDDANDETEATVHMDRFLKIALWAQIGLVLTIAGTASIFGAVVSAHLDLPGGVAPPLDVAQAILSAATFLTTTVVTAAGLIIGHQLRAQVRTPDEGVTARFSQGDPHVSGGP